ncbi:MAG: PLP-dependent aminotransferase family protein [Rhodospirillaceae bacterium]|nr:PLP-dependent aminotransferase family protein [Rhodospirillaceae bacterium]
MPDLAKRQGPKYLAIADAIADAISQGMLPDGAKLPPQRNLAYDLGVTLGTVTRAYAEARRRGLVGGEVGRGTFVQGLDATPPDGFIALPQESDGEINFAHATALTAQPGRQLSETLKEVAGLPEIQQLVGYQFDTGLPHHREAGAHWLRRAGLGATPENIAITNGAQHGILVALMALAQPGDTVLAEALSYPGFIQVAQQLGLKLEPVEMDAEGIIPEALIEAQHRTSARLLYCMPTIHNPTAAMMSPTRMAALAEATRALDLTILEDDVWSGHIEDQAPPLSTLIPERAYYITSLSKTMAGGLRVGYVMAPNNHIERIRSMVRLSGWLTAPLMAEIASRWINDGTGEALARWQTEAMATRFAIANEFLADLKPKHHPAGHYVWLDLPEPWRASDFKAEAESRGVMLLTGESFAVGRAPAPHAVRLGISKPDTDEQVRRGLEILADILRAGPGGALQAI